MKRIKITIALTGSILLFGSFDLFACHRGFMSFVQHPKKNTTMAGHVGYEMVKKSSGPTSKQGGAFGYTTQPTTDASVSSSGTVTGTTDMSATSSACDWRTSNIEKFFNESYLQIAEESAQGQGPHLEALAFQVGCNAQQTVLLEKALQQNYHDVFAKEDINHSINGFYTVVNSDDQLAACWPKS